MSPSLAESWTQTSVCGIAVLGIVLLSTGPVMATDSNRSSAEVRQFVEQLNQLSDEQVEQKAEQLVQKLLGELKHGPALQQSKNRRNAWQKLRDKRQGELDAASKNFDELRNWLRTQRDTLKKHYGPQDDDEFKQRFYLLVSGQADNFRSHEARIASLKSQISQLDYRINRELNRERLENDRIKGFAKESKAEPLPRLPADSRTNRRVVKTISVFESAERTEINRIISGLDRK